MKVDKKMEMFTGIPKSTLNVLFDITGESRADVAINRILKDAIEHRMEKINKDIEKFKSKYHKENFEKFREAWDKNEIEDRYSYEVERDYWDWEALVTRKKKLERVLKWVG